MTKHVVRLVSIVTLIIAAAVIFHEMRPAPQPVAQKLLPERPAARAAVEKSLARWRDTLESDTASPRTERVVFVDNQRRPGQHLREFAILGDFEVESCLGFKVKLDLTEPDESIFAAYFVFGQDPMWVYRSEDFERIMHWEMDMSKPAEPAAKPETGDPSKSEVHERSKVEPNTKSDPVAAP